MFFRPDNISACADVIPYYENGKFYLFYLKDFRDFANVGEGCDWHLITTKNLVEFENIGEVIHRGNINEQDLYVYTGSVIKKDDEYYIFYTGHNPHFEKDNKPVQTVLLAKSKDLIHWEKDHTFVFGPDKDYLEKNDYRDPFILYDDEKQEYIMILTARNRNITLTQSKGMLLRARSKDLREWKLDEKPFYAPYAYYAHECPDVFKIGDWWYLIFSEFSDRYQVTYRMAKSLDREWITPKDPYFDGHAYYAAKSFSDGSRRFLFGWSPSKERENDDAYWQWGGNMVVHELYQNADGTLSVKCPIEVRQHFNKQTEPEIEKVLGESHIGDSLVLKGSNGRTILKYGKMMHQMRIEFDITPSSDRGDFGLFFNEKENHEYYYQIKFDNLFSRLTFDKWPRYDRTKYSHVDAERPYSININEKNHVIVLIEGSVIEIYVNDKVALSERMYNPGENFGFYACNTDVSISDVKVYGGGNE